MGESSDGAFCLVACGWGLGLEAYQQNRRKAEQKNGSSSQLALSVTRLYATSRWGPGALPDSYVLVSLN